MTLERSAALLKRAEQLIPGGVNSPVRAFRGVGGTPPFIQRGQGCRLYDVDGNEYIDYVCSWGPLILGHCFPPVIEAIRGVLESGLSFGAPTEGEVELAEEIRAAVPSMELLRLVNSGTEATMSALRLARGFTRRELTVKFEGCYHGHVDSLLVKAGSGMATLGLADSAGVPESFARTTIALPYNSVEAMEAAFRAQGERIAAVIVEPVVGNMGCVPPQPGFLAAIARLCGQHGALFICDEVMTGFRLALGGAQSLYRLRPDLSTFGKVIGGGLPIAAYGGRADVMRRVAPEGDVYQAGTLSGNPVAVSAGLRDAAAPEGASGGLHADRPGGGGDLRGGAGGRHSEPRGVDVHVLLHRRAGDRLGDGEAGRQGAVRRVLPLPAGAGDLPAAVAIRGGLRLGGARRSGGPGDSGGAARVGRARVGAGRQ